jgi:hypothetical protein
MFLPTCRRCQEKPSGIEGHPALHIAEAQPVPKNGHTLFECVECRARWSRAYAGSGGFVWVLEADVS